MLAGYDHLIAAARRLQWDAEAISLADDRRDVGALAPADRGRLRELIAGFWVAEHAVAAELAPFAAAAGPDSPAGRCFALQAADEARHARFFHRVATEVLELDPGAPAELAGEGIRTLFAVELPAAARALAADAGRLAEAVGLYHLVLEGIVFAVGQAALLELAAGDPRLPGLHDGVARIQADERWHVGLGVLALQREGATVNIDRPARAAMAAWGPEIATPSRMRHVLAAHTRRLTIAQTPVRGAGESAVSRSAN